MSGRKPWQENIPSGTTGAITEMMVGSDLMQRGFSVFRALSPACFCDLIATNDSLTLRVEARTGYQYGSTGRIHFPKNVAATVDLFGVFVPSQNKVVYFKLQKEPIDIGQYEFPNKITKAASSGAKASPTFS
jgi:hypothetical protein